MWLQSFWPILVGASRERLIGAEILGGYVCEDEVLGRNGASEETAEKGELTGVGHGIREGTLEQDFWRDVVKLGAAFDVAGYVGEDLVKVGDGGGELRQHWRAVGAAEEEGARVAEDAVHVADEFVRGTDVWAGAEVGELGRSIAEGFLGSVGESGEEVLEESSLFVHG